MRFTSTLLKLLLLALPFAAQAHEPTTIGEFVENRGQWPGPVRYAAPVAAGAWLFAENQGLTYALTGGLPDHEPPGTAPAANAGPAIPPSNILPAHALHLAFIDPQPNGGPVGEEGRAELRHYLCGADPAHWASGARAWQQLRYAGLWPGIDFLLKANPSQQLEYDVLLAAGADSRRIRLRYEGAESIGLDPTTGQLRVKTSVGIVTECRPRAWQTDPATGQRQPVACAFALRGAEVGFRLGKYDHRRALTIDPVVAFASYSGARVENWGFASANDAAGNLYTAGVVFQPGYPASAGAYQTTFSGNVDVLVVKFNTAVSGPGARAWATYLGGNGFEFPHSLLVNGRGEVLLLGSTSSTDYPTTAGALGRVFRGGPAVAPYGLTSAFQLVNGADLVLTRLSAGGSRLRASTYLGGTGTDGLLDATAPAPRLRRNYNDAVRGDLALDPQGNVYAASVTSSRDFPGLAAGGYLGGPSDGLITRLDSSLRRVDWTTALGGSGADAAHSLQRDAATGALFAAGGTTSPNLAGATGGYQPAYGGDVDGFVAALTPGGALARSTYLGTGSYDQAYFVRLGRGGRPCVLGQTLSNNWPNLSPRTYGNLFGHQFVQQLSLDLRTADFSTVFGSGRTPVDISPTAFEVDCYGRIFAAGWGGGLDPNGGSTQGLAVTANALQPTTDTLDFYLIQLSDRARTLDYATFFGTSADDHTDGGMARFDPQGTLYQALCACNQGGSRGLPLPPSAHFYAATNAAPRCDNAAVKIALLANASPAGPDTLSLCARSGVVQLGGSPDGGVWTGAGVTGSVLAGYVFRPDTLRLGPQVLTYASPFSGLCAGTSTRTITVLAQGRARIITRLDSFCLRPGGPAPPLLPLLGAPAGGIFSGPGVVAGPTPGTYAFSPALAGFGSQVIAYTVPNGRCPALAYRTMRVKTYPRIVLPPNRIVCATDTAFRLTAAPAGGRWTGRGVRGNPAAGYWFYPSPAVVGNNVLVYTYTGAVAYCEVPTDSVRVTVRPVFGDTVRVPADTALCYFGGRPFRLRGGTPAGGTWRGPGVSGSLAAGFTFTPAAVPEPGRYRLRYTGFRPDTTRYCARSAYRTVRLNADTVRLSVADSLLCTASGPEPLRGSPPGGTWTGPGVSGSVATGFVFMPTAALFGPQVFTYTAPARPGPNRCPAVGRLRLFVAQAPTAAFDPVPPIGLCVGGPPHGTVLTARPAGGIFGGPGVLGNRFNAAQVGPGQHTVTYTYQVPGLVCAVTVTQVLTVLLVPPSHLPTDTTLCGGPGPHQLPGSPPGGTWAGPHVTPAGLFTPPAPGTSALTYALPGGCGQRPYRVTVPPLGTFAAAWAPGPCPDNHLAPRHLTFTAEGPSAALVSWDFGDGSAPATGSAVAHRYARAGRFVPVARIPGTAPGIGPCPQLLPLPPVEVLEADLPNVITPNADGLNDTFRPRIGGCTGRLQVYSRWGGLVFVEESYGGGWSAAGLAGGLYYYVLSGEGELKAKGWVEVVR